MRIGLIAPPWVPVPPKRYGGTESVVDRLARGFIAAGHEVLLSAVTGSECPVAQLGATDALPDDAPVLPEPVRELRHVVASYAGMRDVDVIHDHTLAGPLYRHRSARIPVVTTAHGPFTRDTTTVYQAMADVSLVAISHHQARTAARVPIAAVIHHGIETAAVPVGTGDGGYASFLGRMSPDKGAREAVLAARLAGVPLKIAAKMREAAERQYFESQVKPLLSSDIQFVGELDEADKLRLVGESFALLNPIRWPEPFGLVMIEALATGTPVVTTSAGSAPEIVTDGVTGFLRDDLRGLADSLHAATQLSRQDCRAAAIERFDVARMVDDHVKLYSRLLDHRRALPRSVVALGRRSAERFVQTASPRDQPDSVGQA
jgi:glycosyltransferase involved in cell wall biosynthesis